MKRAWKTLERVKYRARDRERKRERGTRGRRKGMNAWGSVGGERGWRKWVMEFRERESRTKWLARSLGTGEGGNCAVGGIVWVN